MRMTSMASFSFIPTLKQKKKNNGQNAAASFVRRIAFQIDHVYFPVLGYGRNLQCVIFVCCALRPYTGDLTIYQIFFNYLLLYVVLVIYFIFFFIHIETLKYVALSLSECVGCVRC